MSHPDAQAVASAESYAAFISYRHNPADRKWARWVQRNIERYRVPARIRRKYGVPRKLGNVFRDDDELPTASSLSQAIETALRRSRHLIVVCSRELPRSDYCASEVQHFIDSGRIDKITLLLTEGEPRDSFPRALLGRTVLRHNEGGGEVEVPIEPLAADVRPTTGERRSVTEFRARFRILSAVIGCGYDELVEREKRRRRVQHAILGVASILLLCLVAIVIQSMASAREEAAKRTTLQLVSESKRVLATDPELALGLARRAWLLNEETNGNARGPIAGALRAAMERSSSSWRINPSEGSMFYGGDASPDGRHVVALEFKHLGNSFGDVDDEMERLVDPALRKPLVTQYAPTILIHDRQSGTNRPQRLDDIFAAPRFISPDQFALAGYESLDVWSVSGQRVASVPLPSRNPYILGQSSDLSRVIVRTSSQTVAIVDAAKLDAPPKRVNFRGMVGEGTEIANVAISDSGRWLVVSGGPSSVYLVDLSDGPGRSVPVEPPPAGADGAVVAQCFLDDSSFSGITATGKIFRWRIEGGRAVFVGELRVPGLQGLGGFGASYDRAHQRWCIPTLFSANVTLLDANTDQPATRVLFNSGNLTSQSRFVSSGAEVFIASLEQAIVYRVDFKGRTTSLLIPRPQGTEQAGAKMEAALPFLGGLAATTGTLAVDSGGKWLAIASSTPLSPMGVKVAVWRRSDLSRPPVTIDVNRDFSTLNLADFQKGKPLISSTALSPTKDVIALASGSRIDLYRIDNPTRPPDRLDLNQAIAKIQFVSDEEADAPPALIVLTESGSVLRNTLSRDGTLQSIGQLGSAGAHLVRLTSDAVVACDVAGELALFRRPLAGDAPARLALGSPVKSITESIGGKMLAVVMADSRLVLVDTATLSIIRTIPRSTRLAPIASAFISPDGLQLFVTHDAVSLAARLGDEQVDMADRLKEAKSLQAKWAVAHVVDLRSGHESDEPAPLGESWGGITSAVSLDSENQIAVVSAKSNVELVTPWPDQLAIIADSMLQRDLTADEWARHAGDAIAYSSRPLRVGR